MIAPAMPPDTNEDKPPIQSDDSDPADSNVNKPTKAWLRTRVSPSATPAQHRAKIMSVENAPVDALR